MAEMDGISAAADPFYQEFLHPQGVFRHANAVLADHAGDALELSLKRRHTLGPFQRPDIAALERVLPHLRAAARVARATLDADARGMTDLLARRGTAILELDGCGRLRPGPRQISRRPPVRSAFGTDA